MRISYRFLLLFIFINSLLFAGEQISTQSYLTLISGSFFAGLFLTFTPCVLPMVPILSSIIVGQGENISTRKAVMLSLSYIFGTAVTYAIMGALAGATGEQLQAYFQNVWAIGGMSIVFALMAFSMFGLFTIQLPSFIQSKLNKESSDIKGGSMPMVFVLGMISALIIGACVSPVLISFLGVAISKGDALLGAVMMFFMALGMGVPLLLIGFGAGKLLPKAGGWMNNIKYVFGVLLLAVAIYLFSTLNIISPLILWGVFFIILSVFMGAVDATKEDNLLSTLSKAVGLVILVWGILLLVGAAYGGHDIFKPLHKESLSYVKIQQKSKKVFTKVSTMQEVNAQFDKAKKENKSVVLYFYTDICPVCKHLKETTWKDVAVKNILHEKYIALSIDIGNPTSDAIEAIKKRFNIFGPPGFAFIDKDGEELKNESFYGYLTPIEMFDILDLIAE